MLQFTNEISELVKGTLGNGYSVETFNVTKSGDIDLVALSIKKESESIASNIYINEFYKDYVNGTATKEDIVASVVNIYNSNDLGLNLDTVFTKFSEENIVPILLNKGTNTKYLADKVTYQHPQFENVCVAFQIVIDRTSNDRKVAGVTKQLKEKYFSNLTEQDMYEVALKNTDFCLKTMEQIIQEISFNEHHGYIDACDVNFEDNKVYVLTNAEGINGASCILNIDKMKQIEEENGAFYILPSSVHECLLVGQNGLETDDLKKMVQEVNLSEVAPEERLDDTVYIFENGKFRTIA